MRSIWAAALGSLLACASANSQTGARERPAPAAPAPTPAAASAPAAPRPMTAAEAAEKAHQEWIRSRGSGGDARAADDGPCSDDADCTLTRIAPGSCCATLCSPRAVTRARGAELDQNGASCKPCIEPLCRDPARFEANCLSGRCIARRVASPD